MNDNEEGLEILGRAECLALMATVPVGRVVFTEGALPAIQPVNFVLDDRDNVIIRAAPGSKLDAALRGAVVAFETDDIEPAESAGWSVTVIGRARHVTDSAELSCLLRLPLHPWAPGPHDHFVGIDPRLVSGHRLIVPLGDEDQIGVPETCRGAEGARSLRDRSRRQRKPAGHRRDQSPTERGTASLHRRSPRA